MSIPTKAIWLAVHRVFVEHRVGAGCTLALSQLMVGWSSTGMRMSDLADGLQSLVRSGYIRIETSEDGPCARLLDERFGLAEFGHADRTAIHVVQSLRDERRKPTHLGNLLRRGEGRRSEDRPALANAM